MKSKYLTSFVALAVLLFEISAFASNTRTRSMGDVGLVLRDHSNIWLFPSTMVRYRNLAILELGGQRELIYYVPAQAGFDPSGGGLIGFGANGRHVIGGFVGESSERLPFAPFDPITGQPLAMNRRMDLFYGAKNANASWGGQLTYAYGSYQSSSTFGGTTSNSEAGVRLIGLALGITHSAIKNGTFDATLRYENHSFEVTSGSSVGVSSRGGHHIDLLSRWTKALNARVEIVPFLGFAIGSDGRDLGQGIGSQSEDLKQSRILAGTGFNFRPDSNNVLGLFSNNESEDNRSEGPFELTFGLGIHYRNLTVDFSLDPDYFKRGVYVLSGSEGKMFNLVTVTYGFE